MVGFGVGGCAGGRGGLGRRPVRLAAAARAAPAAAGDAVAGIAVATVISAVGAAVAFTTRGVARLERRAMVTRTVRAPLRAAAAAASQPACPPPMTITSYCIKTPYRSCSTWNRLLANAEAAEQCVQHVLHARPARNAVESSPSHSKMFCVRSSSDHRRSLGSSSPARGSPTLTAP